MVSAEQQEMGIPFSLRPEAITGPENEYKLGSWVGKNPKEAKKIHPKVQISESTYFSNFTSLSLLTLAIFAIKIGDVGIPCSRQAM